MPFTQFLELLKWTATGTAVAVLASYFVPHVHARLSKRTYSSEREQADGVSIIRVSSLGRTG